MEFALLAKVGIAIHWFVTGGYVVAGGFIVGTCAKYISDYREFTSREEVE